MNTFSNVQIPSLRPPTTEAYWAERNALVDAVLAVDSRIEDCTAPGWYTPEATERRARYQAAIDALEAFDAAHGGPPIL